MGATNLKAVLEQKMNGSGYSKYSSKRARINKIHKLTDPESV